MKMLKTSRAIKIGSVSLLAAMMLSPVSAFAMRPMTGSAMTTSSMTGSTMTSGNMAGTTATNSTEGKTAMTGGMMMEGMDMMGGSMSGGSSTSGGTSMTGGMEMEDMDMMGGSMSGGSSTSGGTSMTGGMMMEGMDMMGGSMSGGSSTSGGTPMTGGMEMEDMDMMGGSMSGGSSTSGGTTMPVEMGMEGMEMMNRKMSAAVPTYDATGMVHGITADEQVKLTLMSGMDVVKETSLEANGMDYTLNGVQAGDYMLLVNINDVTAALKHVKITNGNVTIEDIDLHTITGSITGVESGTTARILFTPSDAQMGTDNVKPLVLTATETAIPFTVKLALGNYSLNVTATGYMDYQGSPITLEHQDIALDPIQLMKN